MRSKKRSLAFGAMTIAVLTVAALAGAPGAKATVITFDGLSAGPIGTTYTEQGYQFYNPEASLFSWGVGGFWSFDHSAGSATISDTPLDEFGYQPTVLTKVGGGAFNLLTGDFAPTNDAAFPFFYQFVFNFADGTSLTRIIHLDEARGAQHVHFLYSDLVSVEWGNDTAEDLAGLQWDNIFVTTGPIKTTPLPAALPLFAAALGGLGFVGWRRKKSDCHELSRSAFELESRGHNT